MALVTLQYDARSKFAEALLNLIKVSDKVKIVETDSLCDKTQSRKDEVIAEMKQSRDEAQQLASQKKRKTFTKKQILDMI